MKANDYFIGHAAIASPLFFQRLSGEFWDSKRV